eukprot:3726292-Prymnesium_polylepis.1
MASYAEYLERTAEADGGLVIEGKYTSELPQRGHAWMADESDVPLGPQLQLLLSYMVHTFDANQDVPRLGFEPPSRVAGLRREAQAAGQGPQGRDQAPRGERALKTWTLFYWVCDMGMRKRVRWRPVAVAIACIVLNNHDARVSVRATLFIHHEL